MVQMQRKMHRLASSISQPLLSFMASPRWWPSSSLARHGSRFPHGSRYMASSTGVKSQDLGKADTRQLNPSSTNDFIVPLGKGSAVTQDMNNIDTTSKLFTRYSHFPHAANSAQNAALRTAMEGKPDAAGEITGCKLSSNDKECLAAEIPDDPMDDDDDGVYPMWKFPHSSHRDGSLYGPIDGRWKRIFRIADRSETRLEAMRFSHPTDCFFFDGVCIRHSASHMLQVFSLRLARIPVGLGSVELYGYIAYRDGLDPLLNYFVNVSRDDPIIVKQGSLIKMSGPKHGAVLIDTTLIEYDMRIKTGENENEDLQLIDGVSAFDTIDTSNCRPFTERIHGDCGAIDLTAACLYSAVEATVEVVISQVLQGSFNMRLSCFTSGIHEEIRLFNGAIAEPCGLKRFVVAVVEDSEIDLRFKVAKGSCLHCCSFKANRHGHANEEIKTDRAIFTVKVTWSTLM